MDDEEEDRFAHRRQLLLPSIHVGGMAKVDTGALLTDRARALLRALALFNTERQLRVFEGYISTGHVKFRSLTDFSWPQRNPGPATDVSTAEEAWKELATLAPGLVVRDATSDEEGKPLSELYPKAVRAAKVVDLFGVTSANGTKKPPRKPATVVPIRTPKSAARSKPGDSEPPPGAA